MRKTLPRFARRAIALAAAAALMPGHAATVNWNFAGNGFWDVAGNWAPGAPVNGDDVIINVAGLRTITFRSGVLALNSLAVGNNTLAITGGALTVNGAYTNAGSGRTDVSSGVLTLNGASTLGALNMSNGTIAGTGAVTITGPADITFGDFRGTGTTTLQGASTISSSGLRLDGGRLLRNEGTLTWSGGQILLNNNISGAAIPGSATIVNAAGATFTASGASASSITASNFGAADNGADAAFNNAGTFVKTGSSSTNLTSIGVAFNNSGLVSVQTGALSLDGGGTHSGSFSGSGTIVFGGSGTHVLGATSSVTTRDVEFSGSGSTTVGGTYNVSGSTGVSGGTVTFASGLTSLGSTLAVSGGLMNLGSNNATVAQLTQTNGSINGSGTLTVTTGANITFGDHRGSGTTIFQGATAISSSGFRIDGGRTVRNEGSLTWTGGQILLNNNVNGTPVAGSGSFTNLAGATFTASGDSTSGISVSNFGGTDTGADALFTNAGTFVKSGSTATNTTTIAADFNNTGAVQVQTGVLSLSGDGTHSGSFSGAGTLSFSGSGIQLLGATSSISTANVNFANSGTITVNGTYNVASSTTVTAGVVNINGPLTNLGSSLIISGGLLNIGANNIAPTSFAQSSGSLNGTGTVTLNGANITFGDHRGSGTTTFQGATAISSSGFRIDGGRTVRNEGSLTWTGGQILLNNNVSGTPVAGSGSFTNLAGGTFTASGDSTSGISVSNFGSTDTGADALFTNAGTFVKSGSTATNTTTIAADFNNTGAVQVQTGVLSLSGDGTHSGSFSGAGTLSFSGSGIQLLGATSSISTANVNFANSGTITVNGTYNVASSTTVTAGVVNINGPLTNLGSSLIISGGLLNIGANNIAPTSFAQANGSLSGTGTATLTGANITFGDHRGSGTTVFQGTTAISSSGFRIDGGRTVRNEGTLNYTGGQLLFNNNVNGAQIAGSAFFVNAAGATFTASGGSASSIIVSNFGGTDTGADALFTNAGSFVKSGSAAGNVTNVGVAFSNSGSVDVQTGVLDFASGGTHSGTFNAASGAVLAFSGGTTNLLGGSSLTAPGTVRVAGSSIVNVSGAYTVAGLTEVQSGSLNLLASGSSTGTLTQNNGTIAGSGSFTVTGNADITFGDHRGSGTTVFQGTTAISSSGFRIDGGRTVRNEGTLNYTGGQLLFNNNVSGAQIAGSGFFVNAAGATFTASGGNASSIIVSNFGGTDTGADALFTNAGSFVKSGSAAGNVTNVGVAFANSGTVQASTGVLSFSRGLTGTAGTLLVDAGATLTLAAASTTGTVLMTGATSSLDVGANGLTVSSDYSNAAFGVGNAFNRRANIVTTGAGNRIVAAGDANQGITGTGVANSTGAAPTLLLGNVHVGSTTVAYNIVNTGSTGPALRGAIQTGVNGGSITDARLSGSGVTAGNWGPVATGGSLAREVVLNVATAGVYTPLTGQAVSIVNNFDNTRSQVLTISSASGAAAYNFAAAAALAPSPVVLANQREGGTLRAALTVTNNAPAGSFTEGLNASFAGTSGDALSNGGSIALLAGGGSNSSALAVGINTTNAGARSGSATVNFASDGSGSSGLGVTALAAQTVNVSGNVYRLANPGAATPNPINLGNARVGGSATQALSITNTAAADGFSESLNASLGGASGGITAGGSFALLAAQGTNNSSLVVGLDTSSAGAKSGTAVVTLASDGNGTSGLSALALAPQNVAVSGTVYRLASAGAAAPNPVTFANARVGGAATQNISVTNTALSDGFSERLNGSLGSASAGFTAGGSFALLAAQATNSSSLVVSMDTSSAGAKSGTALLALASDGAGTSGFAAAALAPQTISLSGAVFRLASSSAAAPNPVNLGNVRLNSVATQALTLGNTAINDGFSERLNGAIGSATAGTTASGSFSLLAAGASNNSSLVVGLDTSTAGAKSGSAVISLTSDGAGTSGFAAAALAAQTVNINGAVYRLANPVLNTPSVTLVARTGDAAPSASVSLSNASPDAFTERLNASFGGLPAAISGSGSVTGLAAGASSGALQLSLNTASSANFNGTATLNLVSSGAGTTGAADAALAAQTVNVTGRVYAPAVAQVNTPVVDFGIVHVNDVVSARAVSVSNTASGPLTDTLRGSIGAATPGFTATGTLGDLAAGATNANGLNVGLVTTSAGVFNGSATASFTSHNAELADAALAPTVVTLRGQVNNFAQAALTQAGAGTLSLSGSTYTLDFGSVQQGSAALNAALAVLNSAIGPADLLSGSFDLTGVGSGFTLSGFGSFAGLVAGASQGGLSVLFGTANEGDFVSSIVLRADGSNASGYLGALANTTLVLRGSVITAVPEPGTWLLMFAGLLVVVCSGRARRRTA